MKNKSIILPFIIISSLSVANAKTLDLPKYGKWCSNSNPKLQAKAIDKIDESCKRNFKCRLKAKSGIDKLKCDVTLIKYLEGRGKKLAKTPESQKARKEILSSFEKKSKNWN